MTITLASVLLVEDDPNDLLLMERAIRKAGVGDSLKTARDGERAIAYLGGQGEFGDRELYPIPMLVLLDLKIPKLSGFEVLRWLRTQPELRRIPVIVLTSSKEKTDIALAYEFGANAYLIKPTGFNDLVDLVKIISSFWIVANHYSQVTPEQIATARKTGS